VSRDYYVVTSLHVSFMICYVTSIDIFFWCIVMYKISTTYVSVFIYFNFNFFVFQVGSSLSETPMSLMMFMFSRIWVVLQHP
jgi:hypothetical protein